MVVDCQRRVWIANLHPWIANCGSGLMRDVLWSRSAFPQADLSRAMELTAHNSKLELCIAISYSSRGDMTSAVAAVAAAAAKGLLRPEDVTADLISQYLSTGNVLPKDVSRNINLI